VRPPESTRRLLEGVTFEGATPIPCPACNSHAVFRLHRTSLEKLATALNGTYPYICKNCHTKFYRREKLD
jgi:DNA-directed RNA polymerase subunit RPC12/RpoP